MIGQENLVARLTGSQGTCLFIQNTVSRDRFILFQNKIISLLILDTCFTFSCI